MFNYSKSPLLIAFLGDAISLGDRSPIITPVLKVNANLELFIAYLKLQDWDKAAKSIEQAKKVALTAQDNADMLQRIDNATGDSRVEKK